MSFGIRGGASLLPLTNRRSNRKMLLLHFAFTCNFLISNLLVGLSKNRWNCSNRSYVSGILCHKSSQYVTIQECVVANAVNRFIHAFLLYVNSYAKRLLQQTLFFGVLFYFRVFLVFFRRFAGHNTFDNSSAVDASSPKCVLREVQRVPSPPG